MPMLRWLIAAAVACVAATGCREAPDGKTAPIARQPQQAGPTNLLVIADHLAHAADYATRVGSKPWIYLLIPHDEVTESKRLQDYLRYQVKP